MNDLIKRAFSLVEIPSMLEKMDITTTRVDGVTIVPRTRRRQLAWDARAAMPPVFLERLRKKCLNEVYYLR